VKTSSKVLARVVLGLFIVVAVGCTNLGPRAIQGDRVNYNMAVQHTTNEQLLLNLVRLRYRDVPFFLEVSSISSQLSFQATADASATLRESSTDDLGLGGNIKYLETPTISYAPLQGDEFVQHLLTPVSTDQILLLYHSGWSIGRVLRICVQRMNGIRNAPSASGPTPDRAPVYREFVELTRLLRDLQKRDGIELAYHVVDKQRAAVLRIAPKARDWPETRQLQQMLGLDPARSWYYLSAASSAANPQAIGITTRSMLGMMFYLSHSVAVPTPDEESGKVTVTKDADGRVFDWRDVTRNLFEVKLSPQRPANGAVTARYRGQWFYIDDTDLDSKSTFSLLAQLFALQSGKTPKVGPVLTLPVGG